jgi:hypothetical protein
MSLQHSSKNDAKSPDGIVSVVRSFDLDSEIPYPTLRERTIVSAPAQFASKRRPLTLGAKAATVQMSDSTGV